MFSDHSDSDCIYSYDMNKPTADRILIITSFAFSIIGVLFNSLAIFILTRLPTRKKKFIQYMRNYSVCCFVISLNFTCFCYMIIFFSTSFHAHFVEGIYYIFIPISLITYSFSILLSICIVYERIQMFKLNLTFLRHTPAWKISTMTLFLSILLSLPFFLQFEIKQDLLQIQSNQTVNVYSLGVSDVTKSQIFKVIYLLFIILRHGIIFLAELIMNIYLVICLRKFYRNRPNNPNATNNIESKNNIINFITCILSIIQQIVLLLISYFIYTTEAPCWDMSMYRMISMFIIVLKHSLNFFVLVLLNSDFREYFASLLYKGRCQGQSKVAPSFDQINMKTIVTKL